MQDNMQEQNGMTLKQFVDILKKSWVTILVSVLIVAIVFGSFLAIIKSVATDTSYLGTLYIADNSNNESRAADMSKLRSADNVSKALRSLNYTDEEVANLTETVRRAISVAPVVPSSAQSSDEEYVPTSYLLTMDPIEGFNDTRCQAILNAVMNQFATDYATDTADVASSIIIETGNYSGYDYIHTAGELISITTNNLDVVSSVVSRTATQSDSGQHDLFASIEQRLSSELVKLQVLESTIAVNGVYKEGAVLSNEQYLEQQISVLQAEVTALQSRVNSYEKIIGDIAESGAGSGATSSSGSVIVDNSALYNYLRGTHTGALNELTNASVELSVIENFLDSYQSSISTFEGLSAEQKTALRNSVQAELTSIIDSLNALFNEISALLNDYNDYAGSSAKTIYVLAPASTTSESMLGTMVMLLVLLIVVVLTVFLAFMHGRKRYLADLEKAEKQAEATVAAAPADVDVKEDENDKQ